MKVEAVKSLFYLILFPTYFSAIVFYSGKILNEFNSVSDCK